MEARKTGHGQGATPPHTPREPQISPLRSEIIGGGAAVLFAKVFFILSGFIQQALLPKVITLAGYGALSRVLAAANIVNNVVVAGSTQGVSRAVAEAKDDPHAMRKALAIHVPIALIVALGFAACAPLIAHFEKAPHILMPLLVMSGVVLAYGLYAPLVGSLNGRALFVRQASLDILFATLRTLGMLGLGYAFVKLGALGTLGATSGFVGAAVIILLVATGVAGLGTRGASALETRSYLITLGPLVLAQLFTNAVMQSDILLLGRFLSERAQDSLPAADASRVADEWVGVYRACQLFAFLPYQLLLSITQILFPMLARARANDDTAAIREYVARGSRIAAIAAGGLVGVIAALPEQVLRFVYDADIATRGAPVLRVLAIAQGAFAMLAISTTILASLGRERVAAGITFAALVLSMLSCSVFVPRAAFGQAQLVATAVSVCTALVLALALGIFNVLRHAKAFVTPLTAVRAMLGLAIVVGLGSRLPVGGRPFTLAVVTALLGVYVLILVVSREIRAADVRDVLGTFRRRSRVE